MIRRGVTGLVITSLLAGIGGVGAWAWAWSRALSPMCAVVPTSELTIDDLIAFKQRVELYKQDPTKRLHLSDAELSMVLRAKTDAPIHIELIGEDLEVAFALPASRGGCYNVDFHGRARVDGSKMAVTPTRLVVGELDLTPVVRGTVMNLSPDHMPSDKSRLLLEQLIALHPGDGGFYVDVRDPHKLK